VGASVAEREAWEFEATLRVCGREPERVFERIAALRALAGCALEPAGECELRDVYLDTPDARLRAARAGLRLRRRGAAGGPGVLTLKTGGSARGLAVERAEWERPWGPGAAARLAERLRALGIEAPPGAEGEAGGEPLAALRRLGLVVVQERTTRRRTLWARALPGGERVAEIALDRVAYPVAGRALLHHEVEIEAASPADRECVTRLAHALLDGLGADLAPWPHGKLALGRALAELAREGLPPGWIDAAGRAAPELYAALSARLSR